MAGQVKVMRCLLCKAPRESGGTLCADCARTTRLHRLVTVRQLAALTPALTEDKVRWYLKRKLENGLEEAGAVCIPENTDSLFIDLDRFECWFAGRNGT